MAPSIGGDKALRALFIYGPLRPFGADDCSTSNSRGAEGAILCWAPPVLTFIGILPPSRVKHLLKHLELCIFMLLILQSGFETHAGMISYSSARGALAAQDFVLGYAASV